jgi:hypothetical protein
MKTTKPLSDHQAKVLAAFEDQDRDFDIAVLYTRVYGDPGALTAREMQQKLAPIFSEINRKLCSGNIEPGEKKRTYRLNTAG